MAGRYVSAGAPGAQGDRGELSLIRADASRRLIDNDAPALRAYSSRQLRTTREAIHEVYEKQKEDTRRGLRGEEERYTWQWSAEGNETE